MAGQPLPGAADVLLADGRIAAIRPMTPADRDAVVALHDEASDESLRLRFFSSGRHLVDRYVDHLVSGSGDALVVLVATMGARIVGVVTAEHIAQDAAEVALLVAEHEHAHGLGTLLLEHVAAACRDLGIHRLEAEVLAENTAMMRVLLDAGFDLTRRTDHGVVVVELGTEATARAVEAADAREAASEARSLAPLLYPRTVAVVGVRRHGGGLGHAVLRSIIDGGFTGRTYVVHPGVDEVDGVPAYPSARLVPEPIDLAVVAVPASQVLGAIEDAAAARVRAAVVITSGLAEVGPAGADLQHRLLEVARTHDLRLVGPNCMGLMSNDPAIRLNATFTDSVPRPGGLAVASQSGGVGIALLDVARRSGVGVHSFVSLGNKADVSGNDLLGAWVDDPSVAAAALYLESFGNARKFARVARRFSTRKPLLAVVGGRSASGRRAGASHTAAAATPAVGVDALLTQAGVIRCSSAEEMTRTAMLLAEQPLPRGRRLGVVSNAGGLGVLAVDAAEAEGLEVPELSPSLRGRIAREVSVTVGTSNPVDLGAGATSENLEGVVAGMLASNEIDVLLVILVATTVAPAAALVETLGRLHEASPDRPVVLVGLGGLGEGADGVTVYDAVEQAVQAIGHAARYADWRRTPPSDPPAHDPRRAGTARARARQLVEAAGPTTRWLGPLEARELLDPYGIPTLGALVRNPRAAREAAERIGFPVVVKAADANIVHKTDRGLVHLDLRSPADVERAAADVTGRLGDDAPLLVQPTMPGAEIALGVVRDESFGPLIMVAAGGVTTELLDDRAFLIPPVSRQDAARAIRSLRVWPLLDGYRGMPAADVDGLERLVVSLGQLATDVPDLAELDLNPVMCGPGGPAVVDAKVGLSRSTQPGDGVPRQLRGRP